MTFRQACGLAWMAAAIAWQIENLPIIELLMKHNWEMKLAILIISGFVLLSTALLGYIIGWSKLDG